MLIEPTIRPVGVEILKQNFTTIYAPNDQEETLIKYINENNIHGLITRVEKISRRIIENAPSLAVIGQHGVGVDNIDVQACTENGVIVLNVPDANFMSVAEHTFMFILALSRNLPVSDKKVRKGEWNYRERFLPNEINGKTLFVIGLGRIGREVVQKAKAFNMKVIGYDPYISREEMNLYGVQKIEDIGDGLAISDFICIHAPLTKETKHLISEEELNCMKSSAFLINLSRGALIDERALYKALIDNKISGAALDVLEKEPPDKNNPLLKLENVIFTPHFGGDTEESKDRCSKTLAHEVCKILRGKLSANIVNLEVLANTKLKLI